MILNEDLMTDFVSIKIDSADAESMLKTLYNKTGNLRPLMKNLAGIIADSVEENFDKEGRPSKWAALKEATIKQRIKLNKYPAKILQLNGHLVSSISTHYDEDSAIIGSNLDYARIHQLGGNAGCGKKVKIPARPYLVITDSEKQDIKATISEYLQ